jgi:acetoin utilization protein AcuC
MSDRHSCCVYSGEALALYNFGEDHPFGPQRLQAFTDAFYQQHLDERVDILEPVSCSREQLELFHDSTYVEKVRQQSLLGTGYLDRGDTPAFIGVYQAACTVVGTSLAAAEQLALAHHKRAFVPIAGLHHARRDSAAGFCVFNDCGVVIEYLRSQHHIQRIAYVDIDAHHGDGVFYSFESDPDLIFVDSHEDGRYLYPGTGGIEETGLGSAAGTKLNIPLPPGANDTQFMQIWPKLESFVRRHSPEFIIMQAGADSIEGDPITHLAFSEQTHAHVAERLCALADELCQGRLLVMGGGGYNLNNIARTWTAVVAAMTLHD